jgi:hypothetical protein
MPEPSQIFCDMSAAPDTPGERYDEYRRLFAEALVSRERSADGVRFRFRAADGVHAWVSDLAVREKACCPFFDFRVAAEGGEVLWDATVVDDDLARAVLDDFYRLPEATASITADDAVEWLSIGIRR